MNSISLPCCTQEAGVDLRIEPRTTTHVVTDTSRTSFVVMPLNPATAWSLPCLYKRNQGGILVISMPSQGHHGSLWPTSMQQYNLYFPKLHQKIPKFPARCFCEFGDHDTDISITRGQASSMIQCLWSSVPVCMFVGEAHQSVRLAIIVIARSKHELNVADWPRELPQCRPTNSRRSYVGSREHCELQDLLVLPILFV